MLTIRPATIADAALIKTLITELAEYESEPDQVCITAVDIARDGFGADPQFRTLVAEWSSQPVGFGCSSTITRHGGGRDCIWKTFLFALNFAGAASAPRCLPASRVRRNGKIALSYAGPCSIGTRAR